VKRIGLNRIDRCLGCGGWRYHHRDYRPCRTCRLIGLHRMMEEVRGATS